MGLGQSLSRLGAAGVLLVRQRVELAALDFEEELLRLLSFLGVSVAALFLAALAITAIAAAVVVYFWDSARVASLLGMSLVLAGASCGCAWWVRRALATKPAFLGGTLGELGKDGERLGKVS